MHTPISRIVDLLDPSLNVIHNMDVDEARQRVLTGSAAQVRDIDGAFALVAHDGLTVRIARSMDRPVRRSLSPTASTRCTQRWPLRGWTASSTRPTHAWSRRIT